ncbi:MAG: MerR family DNA-binding transcriptional regulator [Thermochromatium sp.]
MSLHKAAEFLGVLALTLRPWEREGKLIPNERTPGDRRRYT